MSLRRLFSRFLGNRDGSVAPMLALAALPLLGFVGAAIDFSRAASARTAMQSALDAGAVGGRIVGAAEDVIDLGEVEYVLALTRAGRTGGAGGG